MIKQFVIKNMVCDRCIRVLKEELEHHKIDVLEITLGHLRLNIPFNQLKRFERILVQNRFALAIKDEEKIVEQVKVVLIKKLRVLPVDLTKNLSVYLTDSLGFDYSRISKVFSMTEGLTIEKYFIKLKIEKVKELIQTQEYNFTEISQLLDYSHINHLSGQFKRETGMSLSGYKSQQNNLRNPLDKII